MKTIARIKAPLRLSAWRLLSRAKGLREFYLDASRYQKLSTPSNRDELAKLSGRQLECQITKDYHRIEKGLAFREPKRPFGADAEERLALAMGGTATAAPSPEYISYAENALAALHVWNAGGDVDDLVSPRGSTLPEFDIDQQQLTNFFSSRRSVRAFKSGVELNPQVIQDAVILAGNSPSVCNRQSWKAHYFSGPTDVQRILKHQSGNRGFGHDASGVLVVTSDVRLFSGSGERNQRWIDGGLFAMSLVWALHGLGVATCMLNWSKGNDASSALRREGGLDQNEDVIALIAVGKPVEDFRVARSVRRPLEEIFQDHSN